MPLYCRSKVSYNVLTSEITHLEKILNYDIALLGSIYPNESFLSSPILWFHYGSVTWGGAGQPKCRLKRGDRDKVTKVFIENRGEMGCRPGGALAGSREPGTEATA